MDHDNNLVITIAIPLEQDEQIASQISRCVRGNLNNFLRYSWAVSL